MNAIRLLLLTAALALFCTACKTTEAENTSERPWNGQTGWQNSRLPSGINQGR